VYGGAAPEIEEVARARGAQEGAEPETTWPAAFEPELDSGLNSPW
jgi:hypothetical protein